MMLDDIKIVYEKVKEPSLSVSLIPQILTQETRKVRLHKIICRMNQKGLDALIIYGDREHGANFSYLTGFEPRFEEGILVLYKDKRACFMLGNENMKMCSHSEIKAKAVHVPYFSLPNQPIEGGKNLSQLFKEAGIGNNMKLGIAGWKLFTSNLEDNTTMFDIPAFILDAVKVENSEGKIENATSIFIDPEEGARVSVNANEIAYYEFGAALASNCMLQALNQIECGKTEMEVAQYLSAYGQPVSVTTICAVGERFEHAVVFPRDKKFALGDKLSMTVGFRGGLSSRTAYLVKNESELYKEVKDYQEVLAMPYYKAAVAWYETVGIGVAGSHLYDIIEEILPKEQFHWSLNPGHLTADEEWMSSPIFKNSKVILKSGMMLQMDIIPGIPGYAGVSAEDGIVLADEKLQEEIKKDYPKLWERFMRRRNYMIQELGINLKPEVLPMSDIAGYYRPYLLNQKWALRKGK